MLYDVFICHASEDKDSFVRLLARRLREEHLEVWYDEFSLRVGDSLRRSIERGLLESRFGIVVLSPDFFAKQWSQWELDGLVQLELCGEGGRILPVWHHVSHDDVMKYSPPMADKVAVPTDIGIEQVVSRLVNVVRPTGSPLVHARDYLLGLGYKPPVVTDDWWLDVVGYDGSDSNVCRWAFPIWPSTDSVEDRGKSIGQKAIQMEWQQTVENDRICQITPPARLHSMIRDRSGLTELLTEKLEYLIAFAPQITIPGYEGEFKEAIEAYYQSHVNKGRQTGGTTLTVDSRTPSCTEDMALRDPDFGHYEAGLVTCNFVQGEPMGPSPKMFATFDYLVWLLSKASNWMPARTRDYLLQGFREWTVWQWHEYPETHTDLQISSSPAALFRSMASAHKASSFVLKPEAAADLRHRISVARVLLDLPDPAEDLEIAFLNGKFIEWYIEEQSLDRKRATRRRPRTARE